MTPGIHFVLGGSRSGKSRFAEALLPPENEPVWYVATCRTRWLDDEMRDRVTRHRRSRPAHWQTIEDEFDLTQVAQHAASGHVLLDCLTLWLSDAMEKEAEIDSILSRLDEGLSALEANCRRIVIVSNEIGMGLVPLGPENRLYRDLVGYANQRVAARAQRVDFLVAGLPLNLKGGRA